MTDLLTHVLAAFVITTTLAWRIDRVKHWHVPLAMVGSVLPDLAKLYLVMPEEQVAGLIGFPFAWEGIHTLGAAVILSVAVSVFYVREHRRGAFAASFGGAGLHLVMDSFVIRADGLVPPYLFPVTWWQYPSGDLYLSSMRWPSMIAITVAIVVFLYDYF